MGAKLGRVALDGARRGPAWANYASLMGATFLFYAFNNVETTAMPSYVVELGGPALLASAQTSLFVLAAVALRLVLGPMSDRRGPRRMMVVGALGFTLPCVLLAFCTELWQVLALRAVQAVGLAAFHPCVSLAVSRISQAGVLGARMGAVRFVSTLSLMVGPALLFPLVEGAGYRAFFGALCLMGALGLALLGAFDDGWGEDGGVRSDSADDGCGAGARSCPADDGCGAGAKSRFVGDGRGAEARPCFAGDGRGAGVRPCFADGEPRRDGEAAPDEPDPAPCDAGVPVRAEDAGRVSPVGLFRRFAPLLVFPFVCAFGYGAVLNFGKMLVAQAMPGLNAGLVFTFVSAGGLLGSLVCGRLVDKAGVRATVAAALACVAAGSLLLGFARGVWLLGAGGVVFGAGYFGATTALTAALAARAEDDCRGSALALQQSCLDVGLAVGGLAAGAVVQLSASVSAAFLGTAALVALGVPLWTRWGGKGM